MNTRCSLSALAALALLAGCGGLAQNVPAAGSNWSPSGNDAVGRATVTIRVRVPVKPRAALRSRYVSAGTKGMTLAFSGASTLKTAIGLTPSDPRCSGSPLVCTITVGLKAGAYTATVNTYDKAPVKGAIPAGAHLLSFAKNVSLTVVHGKNNALHVSLGGVPAGIVVGGFPETDGGMAYLNKSFSVAVKDADGYTIVGTYTTAVTIADADTSGATAVATSGNDNPPDKQLLSSRDAATISYTGGTVTTPLTITATAGAVHGSGLLLVHLPVYVVDRSQTTVYEVPPNCLDASCVITNVGGGFTYAQGVTVDGSGNVYVADQGNNAVKEVPLYCVQSSCVVTLGGGFSSPSGIAADASRNVFVTDEGSNSVKKIPAGCTTSGCVVTIAGGLNAPSGMTIDSSKNIFVGDTNNNAVKELFAAGGYVTVHTLGGGFNHPWGVALDPSGNVIVADELNAKVKKLPPGCTSAGCVTTLVPSFTFNAPRGVTVDGLGDIFVADFGGAVYEIPTGCTSSSCVVSLGGGWGTGGLGGPNGIGIY